MTICQRKKVQGAEPDIAYCFRILIGNDSYLDGRRVGFYIDRDFTETFVTIKEGLE